MNEIQAGQTYKINPRYDFHKTIVIRVKEVIHTWTDDDGNQQIAVWAYRVRPNALNVSFGNGHGYVFRSTQAELLTSGNQTSYPASMVKVQSRRNSRSNSWYDAPNTRLQDVNLLNSGYSWQKYRIAKI